MRGFIVIDTTVWISGLIFGGVPLLALQHAIAYYTIAISKEIHDEIVDVFCRPKFVGKVNVPSILEEFDAFLAKAETKWFVPRGTVADCPDPKDNKLLDCALVAGAGLILSSDRHLRRLDPYRGIRIVNPQEFLLL
jgi:putative PIN family toxin of toxin-antitoxin system